MLPRIKLKFEVVKGKRNNGSCEKLKKRVRKQNGNIVKELTDFKRNGSGNV